MADAITLFEKGYLGGGVSLIFNSSNQTTYKTLYGMQFQNSDTDVLMHAPDYGEMRPVQATDLDRVFFFELNVEGTDNDAVANAVARLMRWVDGANQPALRYHMIGDAVELRLRIQLDGATNYTESSVKWGFVDAGAAWFNAAAIINDMAYGVIVALHLPPYSEGASISLTNYVSNGDFLVESSTSGLAQDWSSVGTPSPTLTLDTTTYLVNGVSQKVVTDNANNSGVMCATITAATTFYVAAFAWIYVESGGDPVTVIIRDGSGTTIDSAKTSDAGLLSITDRNGNTWVRVEVSGSEATNADCKLRIIRATSDATVATTFYVDACYVEVSTAAVTVPAAGWSSYYSLDNRADETNAAMGQRNWLDLALIPGDAPALVRYANTIGGTGVSTMIMTRAVSGKHHNSDRLHMIDSASFTASTTSSATWSTGSDVSYHNGNYRRLTSSGTGSGQAFITISGDTARALLDTPHAAYVLCDSSDSNAAPTVRMTAVLNSNYDSISASIMNSVKTNPEIDADSSIYLRFVGTVNAVGTLPDEVPDTSNPDVRFTVIFENIPNTDYVTFDSLWLFPIAENELTIVQNTNVQLLGVIWFDGYQRAVIPTTYGIAEPKTLGRTFTLAPGLTNNRTIWYGELPASSGWTNTDTFTITTTIWPRTRQLLGTV